MTFHWRLCLVLSQPGLRVSRHSGILLRSEMFLLTDQHAMELVVVSDVGLSGQFDSLGRVAILHTLGVMSDSMFRVLHDGDWRVLGRD